MSTTQVQTQPQGQPQATEAPIAPPTQAMSAGQQCRGYILAHQHPSFTSSPPSPCPSPSAPSDPSGPSTADAVAVADPYSVIPCPYPAHAPHLLSSSCAARAPSDETSPSLPKSAGACGTGLDNENVFKKKLKGGCAKARWCKRHWCGACKRSNGQCKQVVKGDGLSHGVIDAGQREGGEEYGHVREARADTPLPGQGAVDASESGDGAGPDPLTFEQKPWQEKTLRRSMSRGKKGMMR